MVSPQLIDVQFTLRCSTASHHADLIADKYWFRHGRILTDDSIYDQYMHIIK
ncbi:hypothetical protein IF1G_04316 [Cordyceps javanica]|uniref:Uncharacterized protein n=1 Tax=Cordyceps javanica TaxID=43265 RepID=A0A545V5T8_9HYPO|nr:hypothetical protein IF1G_04316 [Cordyceps javanica]